MESKTKAIMEVESIELTYGRNPIIANLSTKIYSRSFIGLIGPNGAGKTTLLRSLSGQFKPKRGRILFENRNIYQSNIEFKQKVGYVHENPFSYPYLSVEDFLHFVARVKMFPSSKSQPRHQQS
ncbi:MAG: ATP-binding cassette domain-containing protein [bacterium]